MTKAGKRGGRMGVLAAAAMIALAGCGGPVEQQLPPDEVGGTLAFGFWGSAARSEKVRRIIDLYRAEHPTVSVDTEIAAIDPYIERLTVRAAAADLPCVLGTQSTFFTPYASQGALMPLDDLIARGAIDVSDIPPDVLESGRVEGRQYMIPTGTYVRPIAYDGARLAEIGMAPPPAGLTWDGYVDWLYQVAERLPAGVYATEIEGARLFALFSWVASHGQPFFAEDGLGFDRALLVEWFELWTRLGRDGVSIPPSMLGEQSGTIETIPLSRRLSVASTRDLPHMGQIEEFHRRSGVANAHIDWITIPVGVPGASGNVVGSNGLSIAADCDNTATAASFIDFFANDAGAVRAFQSDNGVVPGPLGQQVLLEDPDMPPRVVRAVEILRELTAADDLAGMTYPNGVNTLTVELQRLYEDVAFGRSTVDEAVDRFYDEAERAMS